MTRVRLHRFDKVMAKRRLSLALAYPGLMTGPGAYVEAGTIGTVLTSMGPLVTVAWPGNRTSHVRPGALRRVG